MTVFQRRMKTIFFFGGGGGGEGGLFSGISEYFQWYDVIKINCPITSGHIDKRKASFADLVHYPIKNERIF